MSPDIVFRTNAFVLKHYIDELCLDTFDIGAINLKENLVEFVYLLKLLWIIFNSVFSYSYRMSVQI